MDAEMRNQLALLVREITNTKRDVANLKKAQSTPQLQNASLTGKTLTIYDDDGNPRQTIGLQVDGTVGSVAHTGPPPPVPTTPQVQPAASALNILWDGVLIAPAPADFDHVRVHISENDGFEADDDNVVATMAKAGGVYIGPLDTNTVYYVRFTAVSTSGVSSDGSDQASGEPVYATSGDTTPPGVPEIETITTHVTTGTSGNLSGSLHITWDAVTRNADDTVCRDGDHYIAAYRQTIEDVGYTTWAAAELVTWDDLLSSTWNDPNIPHASGSSGWLPTDVPWQTQSLDVANLDVGATYDVRVAAVDTSGNTSGWSDTETVTIAAPGPASAPSQPTLTGGYLSFSLTHNLGTILGDWTLPDDITHLNVHTSTSSMFTADAANLVGRCEVSKVSITDHVPAVGAFPAAAGTWYVSVVAVNSLGTASSQSTPLAVAVTHVAEVSTAESGARMTVDQTSGMTLYDTDGTTVLSQLGMGGLFRSANIVLGTVDVGDGSSSGIHQATVSYQMPTGCTQFFGFACADSGAASVVNTQVTGADATSAIIYCNRSSSTKTTVYYLIIGL